MAAAVTAVVVATVAGAPASEVTEDMEAAAAKPARH